RRIKENIMSHGSLFQDVFVPLAEPLSAAALTGMVGTFGAAPATADLAIALSVTLASVGTVTPLFVDDYGVMESALVNCLHFVNVTLLKVADIPGSQKLLSVTVP
nr:hypothetical protein [Tanacetum cinerariifolium]